VVGDIAEDFTLVNQSGESFNLYKNLKKNILLSFYPRDNSLVCMRQLTDYQSNKNIFNELDIEVVGINPGSEESHQTFMQNCNLDFQLLSDKDKTVCRKYKALNFLGTVKRKLVLVGTDKRIKYENEVPSVIYIPAEKLREILKGIQ